MPRYQSDPARRAVLDKIMDETARAKVAQRDGQWVTYLIRDPRYRDKRGNAGTPIYVGQTNDFRVILMPLVIPWGYVWRNYVKRPGDRWK